MGKLSSLLQLFLIVSKQMFFKKSKQTAGFLNVYNQLSILEITFLVENSKQNVNKQLIKMLTNINKQQLKM